MRLRTLTLMLAVLAMGLFVPIASANTCIGSTRHCSGGGGGGGESPFNHLSISNGRGMAARQVDEGQPCTFRIHRSDPNGDTSVRWHTKDGSATHNPETGEPEAEQEGVSDYDAAHGVARFASNAKNVTIRVQTNFDGPPTSDTEDFFVLLGRTANGVVVDHSGECVISQQQPG